MRDGPSQMYLRSELCFWVRVTRGARSDEKAEFPGFAQGTIL